MTLVIIPHWNYAILRIQQLTFGPSALMLLLYAKKGIIPVQNNYRSHYLYNQTTSQGWLRIKNLTKVLSQRFDSNFTPEKQPIDKHLLWHSNKLPYIHVNREGQNQPHILQWYAYYHFILSWPILHCKDYFSKYEYFSQRLKVIHINLCSIIKISNRFFFKNDIFCVIDRQVIFLCHGLFQYRKPLVQHWQIKFIIFFFWQPAMIENK